MNGDSIDKIRHSLAHILAKAVKETFPHAKLGMGPAIKNGFYYDFGNVNISEKDLSLIEKKMKKIIKSNIAFEKKEITKKEAESLFSDEPYKMEILSEITSDKVLIYESDGFVDLCEGPHVENSKEIDTKNFRLERVAGAYFKGSEEYDMLQRVYGVAFSTKEELDSYFEKKRQAEERDHRKIGKKLGLFMFDEEVGQGLPLYLPNGGMLRHLLMSFATNTYIKNGYEIVSTPHIANEDLWHRSGHLKFYAKDMYGPLSVDEKNYRLKPMNCPFHVKMYKAETRSYRELPLRWSEMGTVYRYEKSGEIHGLTRPRGFTQDDAHIICTKEQLENEIKNALELTRYIYSTLGMEDLIFKLSVRDPNKKEEYFGDDSSWQEAENALKSALSVFSPSGYELDEGGAAFYAPKIDIDAVDAMDRRWQLSTIQIDFNMPYRFKMTYIDESGKEKTPFMIHRALLGSIERFLGVYIEHTGGNFPFWLSPKQIAIIPVSEKSIDYANDVLENLKKEDFRVYIDNKDDTLSKKIRNAQVSKVPYILVIGEKEKENKSASVRYQGKDEGSVKIQDVVKRLKKESSVEEMKKK